jgi:glyoxylase-like metal-dependent hydrolase (beta-lactamase superfamily II)
VAPPIARASCYIRRMSDVVIPFVKDLRFTYEALESVTPAIRRVIAKNPGPFTQAGTGTYVVGMGTGQVAVIDPGPASREHIDSLMAGLDAARQRVSHIFITHTHLDHSPGARLLQKRTGAPTYGFGPHGGGREDVAAEEGGDFDFVPDHVVRDGDLIECDGFTVECVHTPGHCSNHVCYQLQGERALFSGDHVMGWSTSVVSPPDGDMADYLRSLEKLLERDDVRYYPTHGPPVDDPKTLVRAFIAHRHAREDQIIECLARGLTRIVDMVPVMYASVSPLLYPAAARSVLAHVEHMIATGRVEPAEPGKSSVKSQLRLP